MIQMRDIPPNSDLWQIEFLSEVFLNELPACGNTSFLSIHVFVWHVGPRPYQRGTDEKEATARRELLWREVPHHLQLSHRLRRSWALLRLSFPESDLEVQIWFEPGFESLFATGICLAVPPHRVVSRNKLRKQHKRYIYLQKFRVRLLCFIHCT